MSSEENTDTDPYALHKWIGLAIVVVSAILSNLGVNIQKLSHIREDKKQLNEQRMYYTRPLWIFGMSLVILGSIGDFEALAFAPQALVASVGGGFTVLANVFFAHLWLGQLLSLTDVYGTFLILSGVVISTLANEPDDELSLNDLETQFTGIEFIIYALIMMIFLISIAIELKRILSLSKRDNNSDFRRVPYLYATASGICGSFSVLLAKCASELLMLTFQGQNQFIYATTYLFVGGMVLTLVLQTDLLNRAIMAGDTLSVFPVFQCFWIGCSVVGGVVFYRKFIKFSVYEWIAFPLALILIILGIYLVAQHEESQALTRDIVDTKVLSFNYGPVMPLSPTPRCASLNYSFTGYGAVEPFDQGTCIHGLDHDIPLSK